MDARNALANEDGSFKGEGGILSPYPPPISGAYRTCIAWQDSGPSMQFRPGKPPCILWAQVMAVLTLRCPDPAALRELYEAQLSKGRAFVPDATGVSPLEACELVLEHGQETFRLPAEAVFVKEEEPGRGIGLQLVPLDPEAKARLHEFVAGAGADDDAESTPLARHVGERVRGLNAVEQLRLAANGMLQERVALERAFGTYVWEALLSNPRLTVPEVARIARKGTLSRPLIEDIAGHASWMAAPEVQRALLSNPRTTAPIVTKILRSMNRGDLLLVPQQTAYPQVVRAAAKKMLGK
jgi:hypothetical protein